MRQYLGSAVLSEKVGAFWRLDRPVGAICHGVLVLARTQVDARDTSDLEYCRQKLALPSDELNPPPLVTGDDLIALGYKPGPLFGTILKDVEDRQLEGALVDAAGAVEYVTGAYAK